MSFLWLVLNLVALAPLLLATFFWFKWLKNDSLDSRSNLAKGSMLVIFSNLVTISLAIIEWMLNDDSFTTGDFFIDLSTAGATCLCFFYFAGVCKRYAT